MAKTNATLSLTGRCGRDPEMRHSQSGKAMATFSVAHEQWSKDNGTETIWYRVKCFGKTAELVDQYVKKGSPVSVVGRLEFRTYQKKDGSQGHALEVAANEVVWFRAPESSDRPSGGNGAQQGGGYSYGGGGGNQTPYTDADELPF